MMSMPIHKTGKPRKNKPKTTLLRSTHTPEIMKNKHVTISTRSAMLFIIKKKTEKILQSTISKFVGFPFAFPRM